LASQKALVGDRFPIEESVPMAMTDPDRVELPDQLLDITALAERLGVTPRHVRRLVAERRIPFIKWGHLIRFDPAEVAVWLDAYRRRPGRTG
jgi:excisionase family DNA binding protein